MYVCMYATPSCHKYGNVKLVVDDLEFKIDFNE